MLQIESIMKSKGVGVTELAKRLNVNRMTIYYYIKQDEKNSISQLKKIALALGVDISELFEPLGTDIISCPNCGTKLILKKKE